MWKVHLDCYVWAKSYNSLEEMEAGRKWYFTLEVVSVTCRLSSLTHCWKSVMGVKICFTKTYDTAYSTGMTIIGSLQMAMPNVWWKYSLVCFNVLFSLTNFLSVRDFSCLKHFTALSVAFLWPEVWNWPHQGFGSWEITTSAAVYKNWSTKPIKYVVWYFQLWTKFHPGMSWSGTKSSCWQC